MRRLIGQNGEHAVALLWKIAKREKTNAKVRVIALEALLNRGFGKPTESLELLSEGGKALTLTVQVISPGAVK